MSRTASSSVNTALAAVEELVFVYLAGGGLMLEDRGLVVAFDDWEGVGSALVAEAGSRIGLWFLAFVAPFSIFTMPR